MGVRLLYEEATLVKDARNRVAHATGEIQSIQKLMSDEEVRKVLQATLRVVDGCKGLPSATALREGVEGVAAKFEAIVEIRQAVPSE
ncbi:hypothetical protein YB2330_006181 [Saitoella coloradoensis]